MRSLHRMPSRAASPKLLAVFWLALLSLSIACQRQAESPPRRYHLKGTIVRVDRGNAQLVVNHEEIPGFMAAMTMAYAVPDSRALANLSPGDEIIADVVV